MSDFNTPNIPNLMATVDKINSQTEQISRLKVERENKLAGRYDASDIFKYLMNRVNAFEKDLNEKEEIGLRLANFGIAQEIHIRSIASKDPNLVEFSGLDSEGNEVTLIQHISQLNFLLTALKPVEEKPFRVGFVHTHKE